MSKGQLDRWASTSTLLAGIAFTSRAFEWIGNWELAFAIAFGVVIGWWHARYISE